MQPDNSPVLSIASRVSLGWVGNSLVEAAFTRLSPARHVYTIDTVQWTGPGNHPRREGTILDANTLAKMAAMLLDSTEYDGGGVRHVITGYLRTPEQVEAIVQAIREARPATVIVDPVLGDEGRLYVSEDTATAVRDRLLPLANYILPNLTEARWLATGDPTPGRQYAPAVLLERIARRCSKLKGAAITGVPAGDHHQQLRVVGRGQGGIVIARETTYPGHYSGTGDLYTGAFAAIILADQPADFPQAIRTAGSIVSSSVEAVANGRAKNLLEAVRLETRSRPVLTTTNPARQATTRIDNDPKSAPPRTSPIVSHPLGLDLTQFPIRENLLYLNHAGTAPMPRCAADAMHRFADEVAGHASSVYAEWTKRIQQTRHEAARLLGCSVAEIAFTKSTTAGLNLVALGIQWKPGDVVIAEEKTFPANWLAWNEIARGRGAEVWPWPERNYRYELDDLEKRLQQGGVRLVAVTSANFATGFRQDLPAVGRLCRQHGALLCIDAIQTLGVFPFDVEECHADFVSADSHKWLMGPEGSAIFYCRRSRLDDINPALTGWMGRQNYWEYDRLDLPPDPTARRFEEGAPNVAGILAMGESLRLWNETGPERIAEHNLGLCATLREGLANHGWQAVTPAEPERAASILALHHQHVDLQKFVPQIWEHGKVFAVSRRGFLRLSPHVYQTTEDMQRVIQVIGQCTNQQ